MNTIVEKIGAWIVAELAILPEEITTIYIEWDYSYLKTKMASLALFGFSKYDEDLGDFDYEGDKELNFCNVEYADQDWTALLKAGALLPAALDAIKKRSLRFMIAEHDCGEVIEIA